MSAAKLKSKAGKETKRTSKKSVTEKKRGTTATSSVKKSTSKTSRKSSTSSNKKNKQAKSVQKQVHLKAPDSKKNAVKKTKPTTPKSVAATSKKAAPKPTKQPIQKNTMKTIEKKKVSSKETVTQKKSTPSKKNKTNPQSHKFVRKPSKLKPNQMIIVSGQKLDDKKNKKKIEFPTTKLGPDSVVSFEATDFLPPASKTTIAGGFVFHDDKVVLANIPGRGWEIIGGRIDLGETPEDTFRREAANQIGVTLTAVKMIGIVRIEHFGPEPPNCPYPYPVGYGIQFIGIVDQFLPFYGSHESLGRSLITVDGFKEHYYEWNEHYQAVFQYAFEEYQKLKKKLKL